MDDDFKLPPEFVRPAPGTALVKTTGEAKRALQKISGERPNVGLYWCLSCGFDGHPQYRRGLSLEFEDDEIEALGGDVYGYVGPCPCCQMSTLVPFDKMSGGKSIDQMERETVEATARVNARVLVDTVKQEFMNPGAVSSSAAAAAEVEREDLPDMGDVDISAVKPRESES